MRLSLSGLLVTLALCCYEANAVVCPAVLTDFAAFLFLKEPAYKIELERFPAPPEAYEAKLEVKRCTDKISFGNRLLISKALGKIVLKCAYNDIASLL
ncbi:secretoglobin family 1D member 2-like [Diceros bicornis minor]|uniref:Secretoglobin family 1D member n=1 Tax=Diceros bicornis minor TaxID=77932 RepID=A0A7J7FDJ5_DICBM|nr:secretoglobin family 1D member 2-like [Diceros bicornis minor]KAF5926031.1 hypothetical protein HPG69_016067 [Diceros bicornis minor]